MQNLSEDNIREQEVEQFAPELTPEQLAKLRASEQRRAAILGEKLTWLENRLWQRRRRYFEEYERLEATSEKDWHPRVCFLFCEGPFRICPHDYAIPIWPHQHLIFVMSRRKDAMLTAHAKYMMTVRRLENIQSTYQKRRQEIIRIHEENRRLRMFLAPRGRRTKKS